MALTVSVNTSRFTLLNFNRSSQRNLLVVDIATLAFPAFFSPVILSDSKSFQISIRVTVKEIREIWRLRLDLIQYNAEAPLQKRPEPQPGALT